MKRLVSALAAVCLVVPTVRAEPCPRNVGLVQGATAPCSGVLVPPDLPDVCTAVTSGLEACRRRRAGDRVDCDIRVTAIEAKLAAVEASRQAERAAGQAIVTPEPGTDWSAVGWGLVIGAVAGGLVVGGVAVAIR